MSTIPTPTHQTPIHLAADPRAQDPCVQDPCVQDRRAQDREYYRRVLHNVIDMAAELAALVQDRAKAEVHARKVAGAEPAPTVTMAFDRAARTIRHTVAIALKLDDPILEPVAEPAEGAQAAGRRRILRDVGDAIWREHSESDAESLQDELHERLDAPDIDDAIGQRPIEEIIAEIRYDLGPGTPPGQQRRDHRRRTPADIAVLCARAARTPAGCCKTARGPAPWSPA